MITEAMMANIETIFKIIAALVGLFFTVGRPILKATEELIKLRCSVATLGEKYVEQKDNNECEHKAFKEADDKMSQKITEHSETLLKQGSKIDRIEDTVFNKQAG